MAFLLAENRRQPMHVGSLQLFAKPDGAGPEFYRDHVADMLAVRDVAPLFRKRPRRSVATGGQYALWSPDEQFDLEYHVRHSALPAPGRVRELLELCSRLHGTRLALERPLWEAHVIEGMQDGRLAVYTKMHHALVDGVSGIRLLQSGLSTDPDQRGMPPTWSARRRPARPDRPDQPDHSDGPAGGLHDVPVRALRSALALSADAAGLPGALVRTLARGVRNETSAVSLYAPRTLINQNITGSRRFAAQQWPVERIRAVGAATGTTINDVVLAMCSGAMRAYLREMGELPDAPLVAMVPVGLQAKQAHTASTDGGNALGAVMASLGTHLPDPADRLQAVHHSMVEGKRALGSMTPMQILAMSALGLTPALVTPLLRLSGVTRPPFNLIISNVPGPRQTLFHNGARLVGVYPLSIPIHGMGLNITCTSYAGNLGFGLTGCRRTVPHLQRLLVHLDDELAALEKATAA